MFWSRRKPTTEVDPFSQSRMLGTARPHDSPPTPAPPRPQAHRLNADRTVAVATDVFWNEDMATCPRGAKVQLLGAGGVASYGVYNGRDPFWVGWAPVPKRREKS